MRGEAYARAAELDPTGAEKSLWQAAACYLDSADPDRQVDALSRCLAVTKEPSRKAECYYLLGQTLSAKGIQDKAEACYLNCIEMDQSPFACRARLQLALQCLAIKEHRSGQGPARRNQKRLRQERDSVTQEKTSYALGKIYFDRHDYYTASKEFEKLSSVQDDPLNRAAVGPESIRARYRLAESYMKMADMENEKAATPGDEISEETRRTLQQDGIRLQVRAGDEFSKLRRILQQDSSLRSQLTQDEVTFLPFIEALLLVPERPVQRGALVSMRISTNGIAVQSLASRLLAASCAATRSWAKIPKKYSAWAKSATPSRQWTPPRNRNGTCGFRARARPATCRSCWRIDQRLRATGIHSPAQAAAETHPQRASCSGTGSPTRSHPAYAPYQNAPATPQYRNR